MVLVAVPLGCVDDGKSAAESGLVSDSRSGDSEDSGPTGTTLPRAPLPASWAEADFWSEPGPLEPLLVQERDPASRWEVWLAWSADGVTWSPSSAPIAWGFSSLHLLITESGLLLAGVVEEAFATSLGLDPTGLYVLTSVDGEAWGSQFISVQHSFAPYLFDPALHLDGLGLVLHAYATDSYGGDPAAIPGEHRVLRARWTEDAFVAEAEPIFSRDDLADPAPCRLGAEPLLFFTDDTRRVALARGEPPVEDLSFSWEQLSVPWCDDSQTPPTLVAQAQGGAEPPRRVILDTTEDVAEPVAVYEGDPFGHGNCTSPALAVVGGRQLLVCAVHID